MRRARGHRAPRAQAPDPLANHYRCRDGRWFIMALFNEQRQLRGFLAAIGFTHLADEERFATSEARKQNAGALVPILDEIFAQRDLAEWRTILGEAGMTVRRRCTRWMRPQRRAVPTDRCTDSLCRWEGPDHVQPVSSGRRDEGEPRRAPSVGQHTDEVLQEAGTKDIGPLRGLGVLG